MEEFFRRVLPTGGQYSVLALDQGRPHDVNGLPTIDSLVRVITGLSTKAVDLYYAVGTYEGGRSSANARLKRAIWLDLDGKDFGSKEAARVEFDLFLRTTGIPAPSILVDSGGGLHAYWPLDRDIEVETWRTLAGALKSRCQELEFNADHRVTADAARVLRAPGTLNHKYGTPLPCVVVHDTGESFDPAQLLHAIGLPQEAFPAPVQPANISINDALSLDTSYVPPSTYDVESMLSAICIPATGSGRRDSWLNILAALHHWSAGVDEGFQIADQWSSTQPAYKDSADVRKTWESFGKGDDLGRRVITIATVIKAAKDAGWKPKPAIVEDADEVPVIDLKAQGFRASVVNPSIPIDERVREVSRRGKKELSKEEAIAELAKDFIYVENQGTYFSIKRRNILDKAVISDIFSYCMPRNSSGAAVDPCTLMKNTINMRKVDSMGFHPGEGAIYQETQKTFVNRYVPPAQEIQPTVPELQLIMDLIQYLFPTPEDQPFKQYYKQFLAHMVQRPGVKIATAILFISEQYGIGKTTAAFEIPRLLAGPENTRVVNNDILSRPFTAYLGETHFLHLQEVHVNGHWNSSEIANRLKGMITDSMVNVHRKGFDDYDIPNRIVVTATSNYEDAMYISSRQERRWGVYELKPARGYTEEKHRKYFDLVHKFLRSDRASGVLRYIFKRIPLTGFNPQTPPPMTLAKQRMEILSMTDEGQIVHDAYHQLRAPFHKDIFQIDDVRALIQLETSKSISTKKASMLIKRAIPDVVDLGQKWTTVGTRIRLWCSKNKSKWELASAEEIRAELMRA